MPETAVAPASGLSDPSLPAFYTCFNYLEQRSLRRKEPGWTDEDCRLDAVSKVWFAVPRAILLRDPVEGFPLPQVLVFKITDLKICPTFGSRCIDYICVPSRWALGAQQLVCELDLGTTHDDHDPVEISLYLSAPPNKTRRGGTRQPCQRKSARALPCVSWTIDVHTHAEQLFTWARSVQRSVASRSSKPFLSVHTLSLLDAKKLLRKALRWARKRDVGGQFVEALLQAFRWTAAEVAASLKRDKLAYLERVATAIVDAFDANAGKEAWHALRFFRPCNGKVKKPFRALPMLFRSDGTPAASFAEQQEVKALFFADMEAATEALPTAPHFASLDGFSLFDVPTLVDVESCILKMPRNKAPGPSGVRNETWQLQPLQSAKGWMGLVLKMHRRTTEALRLSAGLLHTLYKGKGSICEVSNHRSIFLLEGIGKALRKFARPELLRCASRHKLQLFFGAAPGSQAAFLSHYLVSFQRVAKAYGLSCSLLFVDVRSAYYRVVRQRLLGQQLGDAAVCDLLHTMRVPAEALSAVLQWAKGDSLTPLLSPHQRRMLEALFHAPCFLLRGMAKPFFSQCGTRPGDSLADALFSIVFADCLAELRMRLGAEDLLLGPTASEAAHPTWADDLAVPVCGPPAGIGHKSRRLCQVVHETLGARALDLNYAAGKTELLTTWTGVGARKAKVGLLGKSDSLDFTAFGKARQVRLTVCYTHLGTKICDGMQCTADLRAKAAKALANSRPLAKHVLRRQDLALHHRRRLVSALGLSVLGYNTAIWHRFTIADLRVWAQAIDSLGRLVLPEDRWTDQPAHPSVYEVCGAVGLSEPRAMLSKLRICHAVRIATAECDALWDLLVAEAFALRGTGGSWLDCLREDFEWLDFWQPSDLVSRLKLLEWDELAVSLATNAGIIRLAVDRACIAQTASLSSWDLFQQAERAKGSFAGVAWVRSQFLQPGCVACPECCLSFESGSHLATHMAHVHGFISLPRLYTTGTTCRWCLKQFWTVDRVREHLASGVPCLAFLLAAVPPISSEQLACVDSLHCSQRQEAKKLGGATLCRRLPPVRLQGPRLSLPPDLVECVVDSLHSLSSFARISLWRSASAVAKLGFDGLVPSLDLLEPELLTRASAAPPPINPNGQDWIRRASELS